MSTPRIHRIDPTMLAVCGGALSAGLALFPLNFGIFSFLITYFSSLPLFFVGLSWGFPKLIVSIIVAFGIFTVGAGIHSGLAFFLTTFVPALLIVYRFLKGEPAGYIVSWLTGLAISLFVGILIILSSQSINVLDILHEWFTFFADEKAFKSLHGQIVPLVPGISSISWIIMCLVNASLAQRLAIRAKLAQRPYPLPTDTQLYEHWDIVLVLSLMLVLTDIPLFVFMGKNIALISCVPIFFLGLKVIYTWLGQFDNAKLWLIVIVFMSIFLVWPGIIIVMFGVLEPTFHLGRRWARNNS
jgi:hypothetical protein